jgi:Protein of unknown function (DUF4232)
MGTTLRTLPAVTTMAVILLVTACHSNSTAQSGSSSAAPSGTAASSGTSPSGAASASASPPHARRSPNQEALARCKTDALKMTLDGRQAGGAAGSIYYPVDFANASGAACALAGYPGVSFVTAPGAVGRQIGAAAQRNPAFEPAVVRLAPGGYAHVWLQVAQAGNYPESSCRPVTALGLRVYPPGETEPGYVRRDFQACADASAQLLTVMPLRPGKGIQGTTP